MPIDRDSYEPITGNPRRSTRTEDQENAEGNTRADKGESESSASPDNSDGAPQGPDGDQGGSDEAPGGSNDLPSGPDEAPNGPDSAPSASGGGPKTPKRDSIPESSPREGSPPREAEASREANASREAQKKESERKELEREGGSEHPRMPSGRKRRVKVTPRDWNELKEVSRKLGIGHAKVYRIAFEQLQRELEDL